MRDFRPYREGWLAGGAKEGIGAAVVILLPLNMFRAALTIASSDEGNGARHMICDHQLAIRGLRIHAQSAGEGAPLLLHSGIFSEMRHWGPLIEHLPGFRVITYDAPGIGSSQVPSSPMTMLGLTDIGAGILDQLGLGAAHVLRVSFGGAAAHGRRRGPSRPAGQRAPGRPADHRVPAQREQTGRAAGGVRSSYHGFGEDACTSSRMLACIQVAHHPVCGIDVARPIRCSEGRFAQRVGLCVRR
jgi:hypothetical protein